MYQTIFISIIGAYIAFSDVLLPIVYT
ncbi:uncharacterized protein METZ01_LOCUS225743 [marine metagenome]|uniref:Uncharacterized protein n=1 Tax=marine metagenome TaxID=408172 RepID=A0A382GDA1_9ZZZZ